MARAELAQLIQDLDDQMLGAARELQFELAARIRDEISELKKELRAMDQPPPEGRRARSDVRLGLGRDGLGRAAAGVQHRADGAS